MKAGVMVLLILMIAPIVSAEDTLEMKKVYFFPACVEDENYNPVQCFAEFFVPNLHINLLTSTITSMGYGVISPVIGFFNYINPFSGNVVNKITELPSTLWDMAANAFDTVMGNSRNAAVPGSLPQTLPKSPIELLFDGMISWILAIVSPFIGLILILATEIMKAYLELAIILKVLTNFLIAAGRTSGDGTIVSSQGFGIMAGLYLFFGTVALGLIWGL